MKLRLWPKVAALLAVVSIGGSLEVALPRNSKSVTDELAVNTVSTVHSPYDSSFALGFYPPFAGEWDAYAPIPYSPGESMDVITVGYLVMSANGVGTLNIVLPCKKGERCSDPSFAIANADVKLGKYLTKYPSNWSVRAVISHSSNTTVIRNGNATITENWKINKMSITSVPFLLCGSPYNPYRSGAGMGCLGPTTPGKTAKLPKP